MNATTELANVASPPAPSPPPANSRSGTRWFNQFKALFGLPSQRRLARAFLYVDETRYWEQECSKLSDTEIKQRAMRLRGRARGGESLDKMLPETFGMVCVASVRTLGLRPYDVQIAAGAVIHGGALAEVSTGEGKTLVATMPAILNSLLGKGVHVTTVNDYLARRDAEWTGRIYNYLGLSVGVLQQKMTDEDRKVQYGKDITYATAAELGFDFLRDRLKVAGDKDKQRLWLGWTAQGQASQPMDPKVQRPHHYALVDEADNIFVDDAKTPLIIATAIRPATADEQIVYLWADGLARDMVLDEHFTIDPKKQKTELTEDGKKLVRYSNPPSGEHSHAMDKLHEHVERTVQAHHRFRLDHHYLIEKNKIVIIDEATGRRQPDRHWNDGLHQAVEAKEKVQITKSSEHAAQITFQRYFRLYKKLSGMTGTAMQNFWEMRRIYKLWVVPVPTNRPLKRSDRADRVFPTMESKFDAVAESVCELQLKGRPVLIGTGSVEKSEKLSKRLRAAGIPHEVLNAKPEVAEREAMIIAQAGRPGAVTIATNMAGRGTDIILGGNPEPMAWERLKDKYPTRLDVPEDIWKRLVAEIEAAEHCKELGRQVAACGGLHVIGTDRHDARRIDRQLIGRAGRQGDPGSAQFFLSLEDDLLEGLGPNRRESLKYRGSYGGIGNWDVYAPQFLLAQRRVERRHYRQRMDLLHYEKQRQEILKDLGADPYVD